MVLVDSSGISRAPPYLGTLQEGSDFRLRDYHPLWPVFPDRSTSPSLGNFFEELVLSSHNVPLPPYRNVYALDTAQV